MTRTEAREAILNDPTKAEDAAKALDALSKRNGALFSRGEKELLIAMAVRLPAKRHKDDRGVRVRKTKAAS